MTLERLGSALLITAACAGIVVSAQGRGAPPAAPQGRGAAQAPASPPQGRGADPDIPEALAQVAMPWPPIHIYLRGGLKSHGPGLHDSMIAYCSSGLRECSRLRVPSKFT